MKEVDFHVGQFYCIIFKMFPSCLKDVNLNTKLKYPDSFMSEQSGI